MKELLEGGNQIVCENFDKLRNNVEYLLNNPKVRLEMGKNGYNFAKSFTLEKFKENWVNLVKKII